MRIIRVLAASACLCVFPVLAQETVYQPGKDVSSPVLVKPVKPEYTADATRRKVQGAVVMSVVVRPDGTVGDTRVKKSLDPDLDQEAIKAAAQWLLKPGTKDGTPVNVQLTIEMTFTLHRDGPVFKQGDAGVTMPVAVKTVNPAYDDSARQERVQGIVGLDGIVETDGSITGIRVTKPLDSRLNAEAIKALAQWQFNPGQKDGVAVRVQVHVEMSFSLK